MNYYIHAYYSQYYILYKPFRTIDAHNLTFTDTLSLIYTPTLDSNLR